MGWLIGPTIAAAMCAAIVVYLYDHVIVNEELEAALRELAAVIQGRRARMEEDRA